MGWILRHNVLVCKIKEDEKNSLPVSRVLFLLVLRARREGACHLSRLTVTGKL